MLYQKSNSEKLNNRVLILCALTYTNNVPHIGHLIGSHIPSDIFARYCRLKKYETLFIGGSDENGSPSEIASIRLNITPKKLCDTLYEIHKKVYNWFDISYDNFSRTSIKLHHDTTKEFFKKIYSNGYISVHKMKLPFCKKCDLFLSDRFVEGECPYCGYENASGDQCEKCSKLLDPDQLLYLKCKICKQKPEFRYVDHLFFNLNELSDELEKWLKNNKNMSNQVKKTGLAWIKEGLRSRCITRDLKWGVQVPLKGFENKIFYVWFDATIGYISSTKEFFKKNDNIEEWKKFWLDKETKIYNFLGKDNIPFHTIFWPAMLIAHKNINLPYNVIGIQYCNYEGEKISKSKEWGIFTEKLINCDTNSDIWRFYLTFLISETKDTEFKWKDFQNRINNDLISNMCNFIYRTLSFVWKNFDGKLTYHEKNRLHLTIDDKKILNIIEKSDSQVGNLIQNMKFRDGLSEILLISKHGNVYFQSEEPWNLIKNDKERCENVLFLCTSLCKTISILLEPYLPNFSKQVLEQLNYKGKISWDIAKKINFKESYKINKPSIILSNINNEKIKYLKNIVTKPTPLKDLIQNGE